MEEVPLSLRYLGRVPPFGQGTRLRHVPAVKMLLVAAGEGDQLSVILVLGDVAICSCIPVRQSDASFPSGGPCCRSGTSMRNLTRRQLYK